VIDTTLIAASTSPGASAPMRTEVSSTALIG
jgi:hypothetical protein